MIEMTINVLTNQDAHNEVSTQFRRFKRERTSRKCRMDFAQELTDDYLYLHGKIPPVSVLDRLATLILQDELADKHPDKMTRNEYPLLSEDQQRVRYDGERSLKAAQDVAVDGVDYRVRTRDSNRRMREIYG